MFLQYISWGIEGTDMRDKMVGSYNDLLQVC